MVHVLCFFVVLPLPLTCYSTKLCRAHFADLVYYLGMVICFVELQGKSTIQALPPISVGAWSFYRGNMAHVYQTSSFSEN